MTPSVLIVGTHYPQVLRDLYEVEPELATRSFEDQQRTLFASAFGMADAYSHGLRALGCDAKEVVCNADVMQARWAAEHDVTLAGDIHDRRRRIVAAQVDHFRPDVLLVFEWSPLGDEFLSEMKSRVRLLIGQLSSPPKPDRSFASYDLLLSCWPPIVEYFRGKGVNAKPFALGFDPRVLDRLQTASPAHDVTFVGGFADCHRLRIPWLERLLAETDIDIFGYGLERVPAGSPIRDHHRGPAWGMRMYEVLQRSKITLHLQATIDVAGWVSNDYAAAMRLYEATGVGTCLVTERKANLSELFEPGREIVAYERIEEGAALIRYYLDHESERLAVAEAGQRKTLKNHTYEQRMIEFLDIIRESL